MSHRKIYSLGPYVLNSAAIFHATLYCVILSYSISKRQSDPITGPEGVYSYSSTLP